MDSEIDQAVKILDGDLAATLKDDTICTETKRAKFREFCRETEHHFSDKLPEPHYRLNSGRLALLRPLPPNAAATVVSNDLFEPLDLLERMIDHHGTPRSLDLASLGLQPNNITHLANLLHRFPDLKINLLLSDLFLTATNHHWKTAKRTFAPWQKRIKMLCLHVHAKLMAVEFDAITYTLNGSANLCNCQAFEQYTLNTNRRLFDFYVNWFRETLHYGRE